MEAAAAVTTPQEARQQAWAAPDGASHHEPLHLRVVSDELLIALVDVPRNIGLMMVAEQRDPVLTRLPMAARLVGTAVDHRRAGIGPSEGVGPRVAGVRQDLQDGVVDRETPRHPLAPARLAGKARQRDALLAEPE